MFAAISSNSISVDAASIVSKPSFEKSTARNSICPTTDLFHLGPCETSEELASVQHRVQIKDRLGGGREDVGGAFQDIEMSERGWILTRCVAF